MKTPLRSFLLLALVCAASLPARFVRAQTQTGNAPAQTAPQTTAAPVVGNWQGMVVLGQAQLRIVLKVTQTAAGQFAATLDSPDQGATDLPLEHVTFADRILSFDLNAGSPAHYEGVVSRDASEINGRLHQNAQAFPLIFTRADHAPAQVAPPPAILANTHRQIQLQPCALPGVTKDALCGSYEVLEDRAVKTGRKLKLNVLVLPALVDKPAPDPIFYLAGGPGGAATAYASADFIMQLHRTRDVVLVDQRGTGKSNQLQCNFRGDPNDMKGYFVEGMTLEGVRACRAELEKTADLRLYTTTIAMADLDDVRSALGYDKINVYGGSYGSTTALAYLHLYPQHVRTATVTGVAPLDYKLPLPFGKGVDHAIERLLADCAADAKCNAAFPDLRKEWAAVVAQMDKGPVTFDTLNPVTGQKQQVTMTREGFGENVRLMLYQPTVLSLMPLVIHEMAQQNFARFAFFAYQVFRGTDAGIARGMQLSVICAEDIPYIKESDIAPALSHTFYGETRTRLYMKACAQWPHGEVPAKFREPIKSDIPVLMLSGELDPVTPPDAATPLLKGLPNARQIILRNATHNIYDCAEHLAREFIDKGTAQGLDFACAEQIKRLPFLTTLPPLPIPQ
jgi:pimeloyl-ACP methyl ester carboxylesterase